MLSKNTHFGTFPLFWPISPVILDMKKSGFRSAFPDASSPDSWHCPSATCIPVHTVKYQFEMPIEEHVAGKNTFWFTLIE